MNKKRLTLGLDSSTQSLTALVLDRDSGRTILEHSLSYRADKRLNGHGLDLSELIIPPRVPGEADQPPRLFLASLDAVFSDLGERLPQLGLSMGNIEAINTSGQQHGHVYLGESAEAAFAGLRSGGAGADLVQRLKGVFAYGTAPIWKTSNTAVEARDIREGAGGAKSVIELSGSDSPLRFTGAIVRRVGRQFPDNYAATRRVLQISNFLPAVLCADAGIGADFGNGAGTSLMNYRQRSWDPILLRAASSGLPGGAAALERKLPHLTHPLTVVGSAAGYFVERYGLSADCAIIVGSGDNPQTKVLADGELLSLGTSFVLMVSTLSGVVDARGWANAMYDGLGRSFCIGCRTNGALVWDRTRSLYGLASTDFAACDRALESVAAGSGLRFWQPELESFPLSAACELRRFDQAPVDFAHDYSAVVDSALGLVYLASRSFAPRGEDRDMEKGSLALAGGPSSNPSIVKRVAAVWKRPVRVLGRAGAALGCAIAAAVAITPEDRRELLLHDLRHAALADCAVVEPSPVLVEAYHGRGAAHSGYLQRLWEAFQPFLLLE